MKSFVIGLFFLLAFAAQIQSAASACLGTANYDCVPCTEHETGSCRQPKDLSLTKVQAAVTDSAAGLGQTYVDGVYLKLGTATWSSELVISGKKGLVLKGAGALKTILNITSDKSISYPGADHARVTGINFHTVADSHPIFGWGLDFRVDHCLFTGAFSSGIFWDDGHHNSGLVDNNTFTFSTNGGTAVYVRDVDGYITKPIDFGSADWVFVEGNTFNNLGSPEMVETQQLGKIVNRFNTYNEVPPSNMQTLFEQHNAGAAGGGRAQEIYNNKIKFNSATDIYIRMLYWRHGTGLVYNNIIDYSGRGNEAITYFQLRSYRAGGGINHNDFSDEHDCANWDTNTLDSAAPQLGANLVGKCCSTAYVSGTFRGEGYPCVGQPGQGVYGGVREPIYFWNNRKTADGTTLVSLTADNVEVDDTEKWSVQLNRDYCVSTAAATPTSCGGVPLNYTPYPCPHPLTGLSGSCNSNIAGVEGYATSSVKLDAPTNLRVNS